MDTTRDVKPLGGELPNAERKESVRILAMIGIALGGAGLFGLLGRVVFESKGWWPREAEDPLGYWPIVSSLVGLVLSGLLVFGARAAFRLRPNAIPVLRVYAVAALLAGAVSSFLYIRQLPMRRGTGWQFAWGGYGTAFEMFYWPASMAFAVAVLIFFSRAKLRSALQRRGRE